MPNISEELILQLIGSLYDIAQQADAGVWQDVYNRIAELFSSGPGGFSVFNKIDTSVSIIVDGIDPALKQEYIEHYHSLSPLRTHLGAVTAGQTLSRGDIIGDHDFLKHPIYKPFYERADIFHYEYSVFLDREDSHAALYLSRSREQPDFTKRERQALAYVLPHLGRAFRLYFNLLDVQRQNVVIAEAFDRIPQNVIVIDKDGRIVFTNASAGELLGSNDGLHASAKGFLKANYQIDDKRLKDSITAVFADGLGTTTSRGAVISIDRPSGRRALELLLTPFDGGRLTNSSSQAKLAILFVTDPDSHPAPLVEMLSSIYRLTAAEAALASLLVEGRSLGEICDSLSISTNTARTHLKRIFSKTGTKRQSELVKLVMSGLASLRRTS